MKPRKQSLSDRVIALIEGARQKVAYTANLAQVYTNYEIGRQIVEEEQGGKRRAGYGEKIIEELSAKLTARYGRGWSARSLRQIRQFYMEYSSDEIRRELVAESQPSNLAIGSRQIPTIGILLCSDDNKALVELTLPEAEQRQIFARRYSAIIPPKKSLERIVLEEKRKYEKEKLLKGAR